MNILGSKDQNYCMPLLSVDYLCPYTVSIGYKAVLYSVHTLCGDINLIFLLALWPNFIMRDGRYLNLWGRSCQSPEQQRYEV